jgi:hypothetical protein
MLWKESRQIAHMATVHFGMDSAVPSVSLLLLLLLLLLSSSSSSSSSSK